MLVHGEEGVVVGVVVLVGCACGVDVNNSCLV